MIFITLAKLKDKTLWRWRRCIETCRSSYTGCPRRNGQNFGRVFLRL